MNNDVEVEGRPRPLSTGLWTLFSWLRRDDRSVSSESLSSAGSDRTVASFAFLKPAHYQTASGPFVLPPQGPPTDSYKKRVHDRNQRRHHDRDLTLHRKYGLFKSEGTCSYDAFSLPTVRRINAESGSRWDRERRATSECYQRRLAHVPGKRRAPLPPASATSAGPSTSLSRRNTRKRPAPQPPGKLMEKSVKEKTEENVDVNIITQQMSSNAYLDRSKLRNNDITMGCKSEKYSKKDASPKDSKIKSERSFLKQIFDGKKRNSRIDTTSVKILPSISELDKQAAEFIETCKLKGQEQNNNIFENNGHHGTKQAESWVCIRCLRKYNISVVACIHCVSKHKVQSSEQVTDNSGITSKACNSYTQTDKDKQKLLQSKRNTDDEDKQKLKEMLKEMKDSLPKRQKNDAIVKIEHRTSVNPNSFGTNVYSTEAPTLRVGSTALNEKEINPVIQPCTSKVVLKSPPESILSTQKPNPPSAQTALVAQVISAYQKNVTNHLKLATKLEHENERAAQVRDIQFQNKKPETIPQIDINQLPKDKKTLNTPLKISSLLNPIYIPKNPVLENAKPELKQPVSENEIPKSYDTNSVKIFGANQIKNSDPNSSPDVAVPSTSQSSVLPLNKVKIESKHKIKLENCTKGELKTSNRDNPAMPLIETQNVQESKKHKENKSKLLSPAKEQIINNNIQTQDQHSKRRELINQLERSIAKGDEISAAEAAAKLAQLRLSCSVLSFSSQILFQPSTSSANSVEINRGSVEPNIVLPATSIASHQKEHNDIQAVTFSSINEKSPPKVTISKVNDAVQNKSTSQNLKAESLFVPLQKKKHVSIQQKAQELQTETPKKSDENMVKIAVMVEDREATRGPVHLLINRQSCIRDLRREAEASLGLANNLQRWIIGRALCVNDNTSIISLAGPDFSAPFYLCVVESETKVDTISTKTNITARNNTNNQLPKTGNVYTELVQLEQQALVPNAENFECGVCMELYPPGQGAVLRDCVHIFCKDCLSDVVRHCEEPDVPCPAMGCRGILQEREIRALVSPQEYERWLARGLAAAESGTRNAFHCRTRDCKGWALCEPGVQRFPCPVCKCINCVPCQAIHGGETCEQHRAKLKQTASKSSSPNETDDGTRTLLNSLIRKGEALECPECSAIITKKWGCDWVKCSACKTEICWVTRGRRWGPEGKGDTSGGCRCGVDGKRCHPSCGYCH